MLPTLRDWVRALIPPILLRLKRAMMDWQWFRGRYQHWHEAAALSGGYDQPSILNKVLTATLEVQAGRAAFERDSVLFFEPQIDAHLLCVLMQVAAENEGRLRVLDYGGSLGTTYWQHREQLQRLSVLNWDIVEQPHFVAAGRKHIHARGLRFFASIHEASAEFKHDVFLASVVLQYLPDPRQTLLEILSHKYPYLIFHGLSLCDNDRDHVRIEHVPRHIYPASYPVWFLNKASFLSCFEGTYTLIHKYRSEPSWPLRDGLFHTTGVFFRRNEC
jgi:putative methyltransferase (TIGR04325 family)